ncbi:MAG: M1 family metallopeptidase [Gemmatimonadaceae bacterium]
MKRRHLWRSAVVPAALAVVSLGSASVGAAQSNLYPSGGRAGGYRPGIDVVNYDLSIDLPDSGATFEGRAVLTVRRTARVDTLVLDLIALRVDSVLVNGRATPFGRDQATVRVPLPAGSGDELTVAVRYGGRPANGLIIRTDSLGRWSAFGDNWPNNARHWIPSIDHPGDKATVSFTVRAPSTLRVIAIGDLLEETPLAAKRGERERTLTRWRETKPVPVYVMVIAAAPLATYELGRTACGRAEFGCVAQSVYYFAEERAFLPGPFAQAPGIVDFFSTLVGPFPYEKLAHLQSSTSFGGMENSSAIFYADLLFKKHTLGPGLIAHETAHQWFGDAVTEREWSDVWLSEGFATYFAALWTQRSLGDSAFRSEMARTRGEVVASPVSVARAIVDTAETNYNKLLNTNSYQKGGWTLHMLRRLIGDSAFFGGIRTYYAKYHHANAMTDDLRRELERSSGGDLGWFFDQWLRRPGFAELTTSWRYAAAERRVILEIRQSSRFAPYRLPLVVEVVDAGGVARRVTVQVTATATQRVTLPLDLTAAPRSVTFDPDVDLLAVFAAR